MQGHPEAGVRLGSCPPLHGELILSLVINDLSILKYKNRPTDANVKI